MTELTDMSILCIVPNEGSVETVKAKKARRSRLYVAGVKIKFKERKERK
jgi:hypothetical protein